MHCHSGLGPPIAIINQDMPIWSTSWPNSGSQLDGWQTGCVKWTIKANKGNTSRFGFESQLHYFLPGWPWVGHLSLCLFYGPSMKKLRLITELLWGWVGTGEVLEQFLAWYTLSKCQPMMLPQASLTHSSCYTVSEWHELAQAEPNGKCLFGKAGSNQASSSYGEAGKGSQASLTEQVPILMSAPRGSRLLSYLIPTTTDSSLSVPQWLYVYIVALHLQTRSFK